MNNQFDFSNILNHTVTVTIDRPLGSAHPEHSDIVYSVNYGFVDGIIGGDGEWQDAYVLGVDTPVTTFTGKVIAVIVRTDDIETKWVVAPFNMHFTREQIEHAVSFQEKYFLHRIQT